ncbi:hypothetical protein FGO68_gene7911 [Halteria grandinella]|uniref:Uncharacterized protein n=1 Tax=Halteria grandinella TaxID=5974 RepID=A0A8J8NNS3_HALGN|nr:hypothetical protein FGO68_gene7911 [Halteria grandinella]
MNLRQRIAKLQSTDLDPNILEVHVFSQTKKLDLKRKDMSKQFMAKLLQKPIYNERDIDSNSREFPKRNLEGNYQVRIRPGKKRNPLDTKKYKYKAKIILIDVHDRELFDYFTNVAIKKLSSKMRTGDLFYVVANNDDVQGQGDARIMINERRDYQRVVTYEEFMEATSIIQGSFFEVSSMYGRNCEILFNRIANDLIDAKANYRKRLIEDKGTLLSTISLLLFIGFILMTLYLVCIFTILLGLFLLLSVIAFSSQYQLPLTISWAATGVLINLITMKRLAKYRKPIIITLSIISALAFGALVTVTELDLLCPDYLMTLLRTSSIGAMALFVLLPFFIICYKARIDKKYAKLISTLKDSNEPELPYFSRQKTRMQIYQQNEGGRMQLQWRADDSLISV